MINHFITNTSFAGLLVYSSTLKTLFLCYFVFYLPCLQATCSLVNLFTRQLKKLVPMLLCLLFTLSPSNWLTCQLVHSSTKHVHSSTRPSCKLFFQALREREVVFWLLKDALLAGKRCPLRPLLTPF